MNLKTVRKVHLEDVGILIDIPKENGSGRIKKEIRHSLDSLDHGKFTNKIAYVNDDYEFNIIAKEEHFEVYAYYMDITIQISKYVPKKRIEDVAKTVLKMSDNVRGIGRFNIREYYLLEVSK